MAVSYNIFSLLLEFIRIFILQNEEPVKHLNKAFYGFKYIYFSS